MLPVATTTDEQSFVHIGQYGPVSPHASGQRYYFFLIHVLFYVIILIIIYVRLGQVSSKQEIILSALKSNHDHTIHQQFENHTQSYADCSCQTFSYPKQNHLTHCLNITIESNKTISNVFCPVSPLNHDEYHQWLIIQSRKTNTVNFNRTWHQYRLGFGNVETHVDFWIGNENLHWLTTKYDCRLKIELTDWYNETRTAVYESFRILSQKDDYRIQLEGYTGNMEPFSKFDSFSHWHYNSPFSTYDHFTTNNMNCPNLHGGAGWWYHSGAQCAHVQLNGRIATHSDGLVPHNTGVIWVGWKSDRHYSFQHVHMAIIPKSKRDYFQK